MAKRRHPCTSIGKADKAQARRPLHQHRVDVLHRDEVEERVVGDVLVDLEHPAVHVAPDPEGD